MPRCSSRGTSAPTAPLTYTPPYLAEKILTSRSALEGERKQVTVLFADLKGSMELLADRDPEEARQLLDPVLERMMAAVHQYEGTVNQVMGDGIMALFGAPLAHEDHAVRACYAALAMQDGHAAVCRRGAARPTASHPMRVGLNAGEVVVRAIGNDLHMDYSAIGQTTHLAARMEQMAMPGSILLTQAVLGFAEAYVQVTPLGPVPVKGLTEPVAVFALTGASGIQRRFQATVVRGLTQFVGRDPERAALLQAMERVAAGAGQVVALIGEAGVGKSRLVYEVLHAPQTQGWRMLEGAALPYGHAVPYLPVLDLLRRYAMVEDRDDARVIRTKVTARVLTLDETLQETIPALLVLLDAVPDDHPFLQLEPQQRRQRTLEALTRVLLCESQRQPLLFLVEDLHWIDTETQALLDRLVESLPTARLLLLVTYRPEYQHRWGSTMSYAQLRLDPLPPASADTFLHALLGDDPDLEVPKRMLIARTAGNPFFLEESVRTLVETGMVVGTPGAYRRTQDVTTIQVPATVQAVLAARIDRLPPDAKQLLQTAAVLGTEVPLPLLQAMTAVPEDALQRGLTHLQAAEFLVETRLFPERAFTFMHALTHEVAYGSLLTTRRQALHLAAGQALERLYADRLEDVDELLAYHYAKTTEADKAVDYLTRFARKATRGYALVEAETALHEALRHVEHIPDEARDRCRLDLVLRLARVFTALGRLPETLDLLIREQACVERLQEPRLAGPYHFRLGHTASNLGDHARAAQHGQRALAAATQCGDTGTHEPRVFPAGHRRGVDWALSARRHLRPAGHSRSWSRPGTRDGSVWPIVPSGSITRVSGSSRVPWKRIPRPGRSVTPWAMRGSRAWPPGSARSPMRCRGTGRPAWRPDSGRWRVLPTRTAPRRAGPTWGTPIWRKVTRLRRYRSSPRRRNTSTSFMRSRMRAGRRPGSGRRIACRGSSGGRGTSRTRGWPWPGISPSRSASAGLNAPWAG